MLICSTRPHHDTVIVLYNDVAIFNPTWRYSATQQPICPLITRLPTIGVPTNKKRSHSSIAMSGSVCAVCAQVGTQGGSVRGRASLFGVHFLGVRIARLALAEIFREIHARLFEEIGERRYRLQ